MRHTHKRKRPRQRTARGRALVYAPPARQTPEPAKVNVLAVVAHPDDEVLGLGATAAKLSAEGAAVTACILAADVDARTHRPRSETLRADLMEANRLLGLREPILGGFPNIRMNTVAHLELVQFIEQAIQDTGATVLFTHHPRDLNDDHRQISAACQAAARLYQRRDDVAPLDALYFVEIASSTEWSVRGAGEPFDPDTFVEIGAGHLETKLNALEAYRGVMRPYPHPRSREMLHATATYRGAQAGLDLAEAFQTALRPVRTARALGGTPPAIA